MLMVAYYALSAISFANILLFIILMIAGTLIHKATENVALLT